ncbi:hypothetical protein HRG_008977 [Hirsutella rhossiliensis]|uniref:DUF1308 domain-containing protein n=1 Tax=Hirsutella rhossiliensis TaxID=111463 RepID=A0A9P8SER4_9HYPO|nr:uncharacterized protein HRG_08977 [Hirsutella rhossiliensis]KAH0959956.1 hypothetical protein HRG_08977 [Hirsutella rhossiliensis]
MGTTPGDPEDVRPSWRADDEMRSPPLQTSGTQQDMMLRAVRQSLSLAQSYLPEVESLLARIQDRAKPSQATGLPAFVRHLRGTEKSLTLALSELRGASLDADALTRLEKKLATGSIDVSRGAMHWDMLKRCRSLVAVNQVFQGSASEARKKEVARMTLSGREKQQLHRALKEQAKVEVHVVEGGGEWLDIKTLRPDRLARQMTDGGWGWGEHEVGDDIDEREWEDIPLARHVRRLVAAARLNRHEYRFPRVRLVLPNLGRGNKDVGALLDQLSRVDPLVQVTLDDGGSAFLANGKSRPLDVAIESLVGDEHEGLTATLNMDHTILVDLVSDLTHLRLQPQPWQASTTRAQILEETQHGGLMTRTLYPILDGRALVCTKEAAEHFHQVLGTVGTATERERARYLVPVDPEIRCTPHHVLRARFQRLSVYPLPASVQVPIRVVDEDWTWPSICRGVAEARLPRVALDVARCANFKSAKLSIFMHGWATGMATLTSNKEVRGQIRTWVEANRHDDGECGPAIWRLDVTRNLLAKSATPPEQDRSAGNGDLQEDGDWIDTKRGKG